MVGSIQNELNDFLYKPTGNHVPANEDFGQRMWFRNKLSSLAEVSLNIIALLWKK